MAQDIKSEFTAIVLLPSRHLPFSGVQKVAFMEGNRKPFVLSKSVGNFSELYGEGEGLKY